MKEKRLIKILLAVVLVLAGLATWLAYDAGLLQGAAAKFRSLIRSDETSARAATQADLNTGATGDKTSGAADASERVSPAGKTPAIRGTRGSGGEPGPAAGPTLPQADISAPAALDQVKAGPIFSAGALQLTEQQAEFIRPGEYIRRWPAEAGLLTDVTGGALQLKDFKGRPYGPDALKGSLIFLDYGHGGKDGGTVYPMTPPHEMVEKDVTLAVGRLVKEKLEACGATVVTMRDEDVWFSVYSRMAKTGEYLVNQAKENLLAQDPQADVSYLDSFDPVFERIYQLNMDQGGGDILGGVGMARQTRLLYDLQRQFENAVYLSLHCNYSEAGPEAGGTQAFYYCNENAMDFAQIDLNADYLKRGAKPVYPVYQNYDDENRLRLAKAMHEELVTTAPVLKTRNAPGVLPGDYAFLRCTGLNSVLLEMGFLSNPDDRALFASEAGRDQVAEGVTRGVYAYFCKDGEAAAGATDTNEVDKARGGNGRVIS